MKCLPEICGTHGHLRGYGVHTRTNPGRGDVADDEDTGSDTEGNGGEAEVVGGGRTSCSETLSRPAEMIGVTDRTMRRWRERYEEHSYGGL
jgi:hypothetical protein